MADPEADDHLKGVAELTRRLLEGRHFDARLSIALSALDEIFGVTHTMMLIPTGENLLSTLASHGYPPGGVGATVPFGQGVAGVAAERQRPVLVGHVQRGLNMLRAVHGSAEGGGARRHIPFIGIVNAQCQLAVPVMLGEKLLGVLYAEDTRPGKFTEQHIDLLSIVGNLLASNLLREPASAEAAAPPNSAAADGAAERPLSVRYYPEDSSVFFDGEYVIRSLPGSILYKLLRRYVDQGRTDFSLRELRLDPELGTPAVRDNLDARLILLRRRLQERFPFVRITRTGRGRFALSVDRLPVLQEN